MRLNILTFGLIAALAAVGSKTFANPQLHNVAAGSVSVSQTPTSTTINQTSAKAVINWNSFNIGAGEHTHFQQPAGGVALNRINPAQGVSQIYGRLTATGQIILVNPAGFYFGPSAYVNVGGIIVSTKQLSDTDFMSGNYQFTHTAEYHGAIINEGQIIAAKHGLIALIGGAVRNDGLVEANLGHAVLASGDTFVMNLAGNDLISFSIGSASTERAVDKNGKALTDGVANKGKIIANGGKVLITADAATGLLDHAINIQGLVKVTSAHTSQGEIVLSATPTAGTVRVAGRLNASGKHRGNSGGNVTITGDRILLDASAVINVSGDVGAGNVYIGGHYQGKGPLLNASVVNMRPGASILADAISSGNGGNVVLWSTQFTEVNGNISARGGSQSGHGGLIETSSHAVLNVGDVKINTTAAHGTAGTWLLDPSDLTIAAASDSNVTNTSPFSPSTQTSNSVLNITTLLNALNTGNVIVQTGAGAGPGNGDILITTPISWSSAFNLELSAYRNIQASASITNTGGASVVLRADNTGTGTGTVSFSSGNQVTVSGTGTVSIYYNPTVFGTQDTIYNAGSTPTQFMLVNNATNLQNINNFLSGHFALGTTINLSGNFTPLGTTATPYSGKFDGNNLAINNLSITNTTANVNLGLFGVISSTAKIANVKLNNVVISQTADNAGNSTYIGSLVGLNNGGTIINSSVTNPHITANGTNYGISGSRGYYDIGGLIGATFGGTITQSFSSGGQITNNIITNANAASLIAFNEVGGFMGGEHSSATVNNDYSTTAVTTTGNVTVSGASAVGELLVGGFLGRLDQSSTAYNVYSKGNVLVTSTLSVPSASGAGYVLVGGLIGATSIANSGSPTPPPDVTNAYSTGTVTVHGTFVNSAPATAEILAGGLVGQSNAVLTNSYSTGAVTATIASDLTSSNEAFYAGGLAAVNFTMIDNSYSSSPVTFTGNNVGNDVEVGGFVGANITLFDKLITNSSSSGLINVAVNNLNGGELYIGGFAGVDIYYGNPPPARLPFSNDYSISVMNISGQNNASTTVIGGFVGANGKTPNDPGGNIINSYNSGFINNNVTTINGGVTTAGGFLGQSIPSSDPLSEPITLANNFYDTGTTGFNANQAVGNQPGAVTGITPGCFSGGACPNGGSANLSSQTTYTAAGWNFSTTWGIINNASYPYLLNANPLPPQVISGTTPVSGGYSVNLVTNGNIIDTTLTGPNGFFYFFEPNGTIAANNLGLVYLSGAGIKGNSIFAPAPDGNSSGVAITANTIQVGSASTLTIANSDLAAIINGLIDTNLLYSGTGSLITVGTSTNPTVNLYTTLTTTYQLSGAMNNYAGGTGNITFNGPVTLSGNTSINSHNIHFANTISGSLYNLILTGAGTTTFANSVSLANLTASAVNGININTNSIITSGFQHYNDAVILGNNTSLTASHLTFSNGVSGGYNLIVNGQPGDNVVTFNGPINLANVTINGSAAGNNQIAVNTNLLEVWTLTATNAGNITGISGISGAFNFNHFPHLTGGSAGNTFILNDGVKLTGILDGVNLAVTNTLNMTNYTTNFIDSMDTTNYKGQIKDNTLALIANYQNINLIIGNDISLIILPNKTNTLSLTAYNAGYINDPFYFQQFGQLSSQSGNDAVNFIAPGVYNSETGQTTVNGQAVQLNGFNSQLYTGNITFTGGQPITPNIDSSLNGTFSNFIASVILGGTPSRKSSLSYLDTDNTLIVNNSTDMCQFERGKLEIENKVIDLHRKGCQ